MRVVTVPPSIPLLRTVIAALVDGRLIEGFEAREKPERLADATLYLPTQRAVRAAHRLFLDVMNRDAAILPRIVALGDIDEDELIFSDAASHTAASLTIPPAISALDRRLQLARLIAFWAKQKAISGAGSGHAPLLVAGPSAALAMADELARLMDDMATRGVPFTALKGLVPDELDVYWQLSLDFLNIAASAWPELLAAHGMVEPAVRRDRLIAAEAERLASVPAGPVIAAGSTGSMPATARFLRAVASLPQGAVVLPGLDTELDDTAWRMIGHAPDDARDDSAAAPSHPQYAMQALLNLFGITRADVTLLAAPAAHGREILVSEAMRPSLTTAQWHERLREAAVTAHITRGMDDVAVIEAPDAEMEALAIAVAMREAREQGRTAALVTPDRALARRVKAALARWSLTVTDSRGEALLECPAGLFARLVAVAAAEQLAPVALLSLLKHPLLRLGRAAGGWHAAIETLELAVLRGTRPAPGSQGVIASLASFRDELRRFAAKEPSSLHHSERRTRLEPVALQGADALMSALAAALAPLEALDLHRAGDLRSLAARHREAMIALSCDDSGQVAAFGGADGALLADAFDELLGNASAVAIHATLHDYPELFETAFGDRIVRSHQTSTAALQIYGPLESRLTETDRVILGGLAEGIWPPEPRNDPWMSRPMRQALGLDLPERRIGLAAHDFTQLMGAREVVLSHAAKLGGSPAVPSRFLLRLHAVASEELWTRATDKGATYLRLAETLDQPLNPTPVKQPAPKPPLDARPDRLSVTEIEDWLRDPYTIYARHVLRLRPLDPVDMPLSAADRGTAIHTALGAFTQRFAKQWPDDAAAMLRQFGQGSFAGIINQAEARALWWPRFLRVVDWFVGWEQERRPRLAEVLAEISGSLVIATEQRTFKLSARADRIERLPDGRFAILDYKTGTPPSANQVSLGLSPQMTLEAAILRAGGFASIPAGASLAEFAYVRLSGNRPPGSHESLELNERGQKSRPVSADQAADYARARLEELVRQFDNPEQPYLSLNLSMWAKRYGDYDALARIKEWSSLGALGEDEI